MLCCTSKIDFKNDFGLVENNFTKIELGLLENNFRPLFKVILGLFENNFCIFEKKIGPIQK